jgi:hypothetical protein
MPPRQQLAKRAVQAAGGNGLPQDRHPEPSRAGGEQAGVIGCQD